MKRVIIFFAVLFFLVGFVAAQGADEGLFDASSGCVDTDGMEVTTPGMVFQWPDRTSRNDWLFNWDSCVYREPSMISESICVNGEVERAKLPCPTGMVCKPFRPFSSTEFDAFVIVWTELMIQEGKTPDEIEQEITYMKDEWLKAAACVLAEPAEINPSTPIALPRLSVVDILHGKKVIIAPGKKSRLIPVDAFEGKRNRVTIEGQETPRIITFKEGMVSVSEDDGSAVENRIYVKKEAADKLANVESSEEAEQVFMESFKKGDITFTGNSFKVKFLGFVHKVYGLFR